MGTDKNIKLHMVTDIKCTSLRTAGRTFTFHSESK